MSAGDLPVPAFDPESFIVENLRLVAIPGLPEIRIYTAHPGSGLSRLTQLVSGKAATPYWAYPWAGGIALARHVLDHPELVRGRDVLDLGAGSGIVGIAAKLSGARTVIAAEIDPHGIAAIVLNAKRNGVELTVAEEDVTLCPPPPVDLILAGDVFYDRQVSRHMLAYLDACLASGIDVVIGDPHRAHLPRHRLRRVADYAVPDFGSPGGATVASAVFAMQARPCLDNHARPPRATGRCTERRGFWLNARHCYRMTACLKPNIHSGAISQKHSHAIPHSAVGSPSGW